MKQRGVYMLCPDYIKDTEGGGGMPIKYKMDILSELKKAGYSSTRIRNERLMGQATLTQIRRGELVSWMNIETICRLLDCQPGDIVEYTKDEAGE